MRRLSAFLVVIWLCGVLAGCDADRREPLVTITPSPVPQPTPTEMPMPQVRLLFIGNSLTYGNDLPGLVKQVAIAAGQPAPTVKMVASGGYNLEDHWNDGAARKALAEGRWDYVILQQGPSSLSASQKDLLTWTRRFAPEIRRAGGRPALYMVWPEKARLAVWRDVGIAYAAAAADVDGLLLPAGDAWRLAWQREACLPLYGRDDFHPSPLGSWLAALVTYHGVYGSSTVNIPLPSTAAREGISASQWQILTETAMAATEQAARLSLDDRRQRPNDIPLCSR